MQEIIQSATDWIAANPIFSVTFAFLGAICLVVIFRALITARRRHDDIPF